MPRTPLVLFVSTSSDFYGAPRSLFHLVTGLDARLRATVAIPAGGELADQLAHKGVPFVISPADPYVPPPPGCRRGTWASLHTRFRWLHWLYGLIRRSRPDVVYINTLRGATAAIAARLAGVPCVWHLRGLETGLSRPLYRATRLRLVALLASRVITVAEAVAAPLRALGVGPERLAVVYNGVELPVALPEPREPHHHPVVCYLGRLTPDKGVLDFLTAAARLAATDHVTQFRLVGGPVGIETNAHWPAILRLLASTPDLGGRVEFTGFVTDPRQALHECDIVTLPSHDEGFPRAVLEAMALAKPVVATRVGGVPEAINDGVHGLLVPPGDAEALAVAWRRLLDDRPLRGRLGREARQRVAQRFTLDSYVRGVERVLLSVLPTG